MSFPKKPNALKVIDGSRQPMDAEPLVNFECLDEVPPAPDWMPNAHAIKEWNRLAPILHKNRLLTEAGLSPLGMLCALHGKIVQLYAAGESPTGHMLAQYRNIVNDFGLTPVAQGKVKPLGEEKKVNRFGGNGKRPTGTA